MGTFHVQYFGVWTRSWETLSSFSKQMVVLNVDRLAASSTVASFYSSPALLLSHPVLHITNRKLKLHHWSALLCSFGIERNGNVTLGHQRTSYILTLAKCFWSHFHFCFASSLQYKYEAIFKFTLRFASQLTLYVQF